MLALKVIALLLAINRICSQLAKKSHQQVGFDYNLPNISDIFDYCSYTCEGNLSHLLCPMATEWIESSSHCKNYVIVKFNKQSILNDMNTFRNKFANLEWPSQYMFKHTNYRSSSMLKMYWDEELETMAELWAASCSFNQVYPCIDVARFPVVELAGTYNVSWYFDADLRYAPKEIEESLGNVLNLWTTTPFREGDKSKDKWRSIDILSSDSISRVGCGLVLYSDWPDKSSNDKKGDFFKELNRTKRDNYIRFISVAVCNFGPALERRNRRGTPASFCPNGTSSDKNYIFLCGGKDIWQDVDLTDSNFTLPTRVMSKGVTRTSKDFHRTRLKRQSSSAIVRPALIVYFCIFIIFF